MNLAFSLPSFAQNEKKLKNRNYKKHEINQHNKKEDLKTKMFNVLSIFIHNFDDYNEEIKIINTLIDIYPNENIICLENEINNIKNNSNNNLLKHHELIYNVIDFLYTKSKYKISDIKFKNEIKNILYYDEVNVFNENNNKKEDYGMNLGELTDEETKHHKLHSLINFNVLGLFYNKNKQRYQNKNKKQSYNLNKKHLLNAITLECNVDDDNDDNDNDENVLNNNINKKLIGVDVDVDVDDDDDDNNELTGI